MKYDRPDQFANCYQIENRHLRECWPIRCHHMQVDAPRLVKGARMRLLFFSVSNGGLSVITLFSHSAWEGKASRYVDMETRIAV